MLERIAGAAPLDPLRELHHPERRHRAALRRRARPSARATASACACCPTGIGSLDTRARYWRDLRGRRRGARLPPAPLAPPRRRTSPATTASWWWPTARRAVTAASASATSGPATPRADGSPGVTRAVRSRARRGGAGPGVRAVWQARRARLPDDELAGRGPAAGRRRGPGDRGRARRERAFRVDRAARRRQRSSGSGSPMPIWSRRRGSARRCSTRPRDGVDVRLLVPGTSDLPAGPEPHPHRLSRAAPRPGSGSTSGAARCCTPRPSWWTAAGSGSGSSNLNLSSLIANYELDVLVEDPALAEAMERQFRLDIARSREVTRRPVRGPRRISQALPTALHHREPDDRERALPPLEARGGPAAPRWRSGPSPRTRGGRSSCLSRRSSCRSGVLFFVLPRVTAYVFGAICAWLALGAGREAFRRRADR